MDFACGKEGTSKELLSRKIYGTKVKYPRDRTNKGIPTQVDMPNVQVNFPYPPFIDDRVFLRIFSFDFQR